MEKRMGEHPKHIAALETLWYDDVDHRVNVTPILEIVSRMHQIKYAYLTCNTRDELNYNLSLLKRKKGYGILYLAFHGQAGQLRLANHADVKIEQLSQIMGKGFTNWVLHFGSCGILDADRDRLVSFMEATKVAMISGYSRPDLDWLESAAMDILYFQLLQHHDNMREMWDKLTELYGGLVSRTGFGVFLA